MTKLRAVRRVVAPTTLCPAARSVVVRLAEEHGLTVVDCLVVGDTLVTSPASGDVLAHSIPDVFGRALEPPPGWTVARILDVALDVATPPGTIRFGRPAVRIPADMSRRLRDVWKPLGQQRRVRPLHSEPGPYGLPFIAPSGIDVPDDLKTTPVSWPGLADLVVVHHPEVTAWEAYDGPIESSEWT